MRANLRNGGNGTGRDSLGRFRRGSPGGPGRPAGSPNRTTIDGRVLRREFYESWKRNDGPALLDRLASEDPHAYLKLMVRLLPHGDEDAPPDPEEQFEDMTSLLMSGEAGT